VKRPAERAAPPPFVALHPHTSNLGDHLQSIAAERLLARHGIVPSGAVDRDRGLGGPPVDGPTAPRTGPAVLLNGWFKHGRGHWPPHPAYRPIYLGTHLDADGAGTLLSPHALDHYRANGPIGCRDDATADTLAAAGVEAFVSNCLTLTFEPRRADPERRTEIVAVVDDAALRAAVTGHRSLGPVRMLSHLAGTTDFTANRRTAEALLAIYARSARLVVTTRLHCALPALALGIPTVVFHPFPGDVPQVGARRRFSTLARMIRVYEHDEFDDVDWDPAPLDVTPWARRIDRALAEAIDRLR